MIALMGTSDHIFSPDTTKISEVLIVSRNRADG